MNTLDTIFARNCHVKRITKPEAAAFLNANHRLGSTGGRYFYGLFVERSTGASESHIKEGTLAAVAVFSNARRWNKEGYIIRSYEWIRYASLKELRVTGGMGKLLNAFISDIHPDDIMSYADTEYPDGGDAYKQLGFTQDSIMECDGHINIKYRLRPIPTHTGK
ncbi:MAG TPA: hypothetical protein DHU72_03295 [Rikenellaceae bacterium]|nr:hypothetical protein [Rikenellaceae bacterium]HBH21241.1 hypothetical protein [Rikenellaceae bacterium]HCZ22486.1 hypothetical protein [Rikenellaceae bacterium]